MPSRLAGFLLGLLFLWAALASADEPKQRPLAPAQQKLLQQRATLIPESNRLARAGKFAEAIDCVEKVLAIEREVFGNEHAFVARSLSQLARLNELREDFPAADKYAKEALALHAKLYGENNWRTVNARVSLAAIEQEARLEVGQRRRLAEADRQCKEGDRLAATEQWTAALALAQKSLAARKEILGVRHLDTCSSLDQMASFLEKTGQAAKAEVVMVELLDARRQMLGERHPTTATTKNNLAVLADRLGDPDRAEQLYREALDIFKEVHGEQSHDYIVGLANLAHFYDKRDETAKAEAQYRRALELREKLDGRKGLEYAKILRTQARGYHEHDNYARAEPLYREVLEIRRAQLGPKDPQLAASLNELATLLANKGDHEGAVVLHRQALAICVQAFGEKNRTVATYLANLAAPHIALGKFDEAERLLLRSLALRKELLGPTDPEVANSLNNLGHLYREMNDFARGEAAFVAALKITAALPGRRQLGHADILHNYGGLCYDRGDLDRAEALFRQALDIRKKWLGENCVPCALSLHQLGRVFVERGNYVRAEPLYRQALAIRKQQLGEKHPGYGRVLGNLAGLYVSMGDFARAEPLYRQVLALCKAAVGESSRDYASALNNLGHLLELTRRPAEAERCYRQALEIQKAVTGEKGTSYAAFLNNLGALYAHLGKYDDAEPLLRQALEVWRQALGEEHRSYAVSLGQLANVEQGRGNFDEAEKLRLRACAITRKALGPKHPGYARDRKYLAELHLARGNPAAAEEVLREVLAVYAEHMQDTFSVQSERQRLTFLRQLRDALDAYLSAAIGAGKEGADMYAHVLAWKGALAVRTAEERAARDQPKLKQLADELAQTRSHLARLAFAAPRPEQRDAWRKQMDELRQEKEDLEARLARESAAFRQEQKLSRAGPADVARALPEGTALVDFIMYQHLGPPKRKGELEAREFRLAAFVVRRDRAPVVVALGPLKTVTDELQAWRKALEGGEGGALGAAGERAAKLVWQPLAGHLTGAKTVLVAPDGPLCQVPLGALPGSRPGTYLLEEVGIAQVISGRHAIECFSADDRVDAQGLLAVGGIDYGPAPGDGKRQARFGNLPGTELEARSVSAIFGRAFPQARKALLSGDEPTEARLKEELRRSKDQRWRFLHLATHGFFASPTMVSALAVRDRPARATSGDGAEDEPVLGLNPMLLSGVVLAGANRGRPASEADTVGILTAEEVASLDLRGSELVVLSACETGLGELAGGEGVFGLQRAFQTAGARSLVTSLWRVDDAATTVLMEEFYANLWQKKLPKLEALRQAQLTLLKEPDRVAQRRKQLKDDLAKRGLKLDKSVPLPDDGIIQKRSHPAWWAAFILSGDPR